MNAQQESRIAITLPREAHEFARLFAAKQADVSTGKQVYLNTLAVYAVHLYLNQQGIATDLDSSDSWYPTAITPPDSADLVLPDIDDAKVECRAVLLDSDKLAMSISESAWSDRIAYIAVGFGEVLDCAYLLGFFHPLDPNRRVPNTLQLNSRDCFPASGLIAYLSDLKANIDKAPVFIALQERLKEHSLSDIVAQLNRIRLTEDVNYFWNRRIEEYIRSQNPDAAATRDLALKSYRQGGDLENDLEASDPALKALAEEVADFMRSLWGENPQAE